MTSLFKALNGDYTPVSSPMANASPMMPNAGFGGVLGRAQQLAGILKNPQGLVQRYFPDAPAEVTGNPDSLLQWMQQTGKVNPQMVQMARQMMGR